MLRFASSVALRIASGTSRALPLPKPARPFWSPTTTSAAKPKFLPPFTVFGDAVDTDQFVDEFALLLFVTIPAASAASDLFLLPWWAS